MDVVKDWETLVSYLKQRIQNGDSSCRPLLDEAEANLKKAREKQAILERDRNE